MTNNLNIPTFSLSDSAADNFNRYNEFMQNTDSAEDKRTCKWTFEMYVKSCGIAEKERKRSDKEDAPKVEFEISGKKEGKGSDTLARKVSARTRKQG